MSIMKDGLKFEISAYLEHGVIVVFDSKHLMYGSIENSYSVTTSARISLFLMDN